MTKSLRQNPPGTKTPWDKNPMGQKPPIIIIRGFCPTFKIGGFCPRGLCPRGILSHTYIHTQTQKHRNSQKHTNTHTHTHTNRHTTPPPKHHQGKKKVHGVWFVYSESTTIELSKKGKIKIFV